jgi:hypothetical protein
MTRLILSGGQESASLDGTVNSAPRRGGMLGSLDKNAAAERLHRAADATRFGWSRMRPQGRADVEKRIVGPVAWELAHSVEFEATLTFAWAYLTNVGNGDDPPAEFELDGPLAAGSRCRMSV